MSRSPFDFASFTRDVLAARRGDTAASARLVRATVPAAARALLPQLGGAIDVAGTLFEQLAPVGPNPYGGVQVADGTFWRWVAESTYGVYVVFGSKRTGKTALLCTLADIWAPSARGGLYCVGVPPDGLADSPLMPFSWSVRNLSRLPLDSVLIIPDAGLYLDARSWGEGPEEVMRRLVILAGQRRIRIAADAQYSGLIARSLLEARALIYKPMGPAFMTLERSNLRPLAEQAQDELAKLGSSLEALRPFAYAYADEIGFSGPIAYRPPEWFGSAISNSHRFDDITDGPRVVDVGDPDDEPDDVVVAPRRGDGAPGRPPRWTP